MSQDLFLPPAPQVCLQRVGSTLPTREVPGKGSEAKGGGEAPRGSSAGSWAAARRPGGTLWWTHGAHTQPGNSGVAVLVTHVFSDPLSIPVPLPCGSGSALATTSPTQGQPLLKGTPNLSTPG